MKKIDIIKKMISDKKEIRKHIQNGGNIDDLPTEKYGFKQPL